MKEIILPVTDEKLAELTGLSKKAVALYRREMQKLPTQQRHLANGGHMAYLEGFKNYLDYRFSLEWRKEWAKVQKMRGA